MGKFNVNDEEPLSAAARDAAMGAVGLASLDAKSIKRIAKASEFGDLFSPRLWWTWSQVADAAFEQVLVASSKSSVDAINGLRGGHGESGFVGLGSSVAKCVALAKAGIDPQSPCEIGDKPCHPWSYAAFVGDLGPMEGLMALEIECPSSLGKVGSTGFPAEAGNIPMLMALGDWQMERIERGPDRLDALAKWMAKSSSLGARGPKGLDALKLSIEKGFLQWAGALLDAGADPRSVDAKGLDAMGILDRRIKACLLQNNSGKVRDLESFKGRLLCAMESRALDGLPEAPASRIRTRSI